MDCAEINADSNDSLAEFNEAIRGLKHVYQIARIPEGRTDMLLSAQALGFKVIETNIQLSRTTKNYRLPRVYQRFEPFINILEADKQSVDKVLALIKEGDLFVTDKIAKDPFFSTKKSGNRYYHWSKDILQRGAHMYLAQYKGENIGFALNYSIDDKFYNAFIGGVFPNYVNKGLGFLPLHANNISIADQGGLKIQTGVSSNNPSILRLHMVFDFRIDKISYILIKHL